MKGSALQRATVLALTIPAFVACASARRSDTSMAAGTIAVPATIEVPPISRSEADLLRRMTDPNILGHIAMADSVEAVMAQFAQQRTKNDDVLQFARQMNVDHNTDRQAVENLARTTGAGMHTIVGELRMSHMGTLVDSVGPQISEVTFDRNYILANVQMHEHMLGELEALQGTAQNPAIRDHVTAMIPVVQAHLDRARAIARKYDYASRRALRSPNPSNPSRP